MGFMKRLVEALVDVLNDDQSQHDAPTGVGGEQVDQHGLPLDLSASERDTALARRWGTFDASVPGATPYTDTD